MNELLVIAQIAGRRCALRADDVQSVIELGEISPVPRTEAYVAGITALRSQALTVIDSRLALGFDESRWPTDRRAAAVNVGGYPYAVLVDAIEDVTTSASELRQVSGGFGEEWSRVAKGMIETGIGPALLIDLPLLIAGPGDRGDASGGQIGAAA